MTPSNAMVTTVQKLDGVTRNVAGLSAIAVHRIAHESVRRTQTAMLAMGGDDMAAPTPVARNETKITRGASSSHI